MRRSLLALLALDLAAAAVAVPPAVAETTPTPAQLTDPTTRKGTRNYRPSDATTLPGAATGTQAQDTGPSKKEKLSQCMDTWDKGTHITKSKWREICQRQLNEP